MKRLLFSSFFLALLVAFAGCKKCNCFDSSLFGRTDFTGTWKGTITAFKNNQRIVKSGELVLYPVNNGASLGGIMIFEETSRLVEVQLNNGQWYFTVICSDTLNPQCSNWSLTGFAAFSDEQQIEINIAGNECGPSGKQFVSYEGTLSKYNDVPDPSAYFSFAKAGNIWGYKTTLNSTDTCSLNYQMGNLNPSGIFEGNVTNNCGWPWQYKSFYWYVDPAMFSVMADATSGSVIARFPIDMPTGTTYTYYYAGDTTNITLEARDVNVTLPLGNFNCIKFRQESTSPWVKGGGLKTSYIWINNQFGIVKQEFTNPVDSTDMVMQVLSSKNF